MVTQVASNFLRDSAGVFPIIKADNTHIGLGHGADTPQDFEGYIGDGDYIRLPSTETGNIDYFNDTGSSQAGWPISINDVKTGDTTWLGFCMDETDNLLYVCTRGATLTEFTLSSITNVGNIFSNDTYTVTLPNAGAEWAWGKTGSGAGDVGACNFVREADGIGNFTMYINSNQEYTEEIEFAVGGTLVRDSVRTVRVVRTGIPAVAALHYSTPNGNYAGLFGPASVEGEFVAATMVDVGSGIGLESKFAKLLVPYDTGIFSHNDATEGPGGYPTLWKGRIIIARHGDRSRGPVYFDQNEFNKWVDAMAIVGGVA